MITKTSVGNPRKVVFFSTFISFSQLRAVTANSRDERVRSRVAVLGHETRDRAPFEPLHSRAPGSNNRDQADNRFDFVSATGLLMKETAISDQSIICAMSDDELRWKLAALPTDLSRKAVVCSRGKTPSENRMKSAFAISFAKGSTSSSRNGRRTRRGVSRRGIQLMKTKTQRVSIHNRICQRRTKNMVVPRGHQIRQAWLKCAPRRANAPHVIFISAPPKPCLAKVRRTHR